MVLADKKMALIYLTAIFFITLDRFLKVLALQIVNEKWIVPDYFSFTFAANKYIAFSLPVSGYFLTVFIGSVIMLLMFYLLRLIYQKDHLFSGALVFLILGAFSNFFDRLRFGFVIDYFYLKYFTVFNVADAMIVGAAFYIIFLGLKNKKISR
jgi:signal peptidase II